MNDNVQTINTRTSRHYLQNTNAADFEEIKTRIYDLILTYNVITNLVIAEYFNIDISAVRARDCVYIRAIEELENENRIQTFYDGKKYFYRLPQLTLL